MDVEQATEKLPMSYEGEPPLLLVLIGGEEKEGRCKSVPYYYRLIIIKAKILHIEIRCRSLDGIVFGRLACSPV